MQKSKYTKRSSKIQFSSLNPELLYNILSRLTAQQKFLIAYSGGLDSHVLLHNMAKLRELYPSLQLRAVHINHGLSDQANHWAEHCRNICTDLAIECLVKKIVIKRNNKESLEALARTLRYKEITALLINDECLLTAHNQNDQAETLLLQLLRGAGPKGLAAMPEKNSLEKGCHLRPFLNFSRVVLENYAKTQQLQWIEDESNLNLNFDRNYIRQKLMPLIKQRWSGATTTLARSAKHAASVSKLLAEIGRNDLAEMQGSVTDTLSIKKLLMLSYERQQNVLREWIIQQQFPLPSTIKIQQIQKEVLLARVDAKPLVKWQTTEVRRYQDDLYIMSPVMAVDTAWQVVWDMQSPLPLPENLGLLVTSKQLSENVVVRFREKGERCHPVGRSGSHLLKKLFQEWQVPTWKRDRTPLIFYKNELIAVPGYFGSDFQIERH